MAALTGSFIQRWVVRRSIAAFATAYQKGRAAELRKSLPSGTLKKALNQVVHSGDKNGGTNPYADPTNSYDPRAQEVIEKAILKP